MSSAITAPTMAPVGSEEEEEQLVQDLQVQEVHLFSQQPAHEPLPQLHWLLGQEDCARRAAAGP